MSQDLEWIVSTARQSDPSLDHDIAQKLAGEALRILAGTEPADAPSVARALFAAHPRYGATSANVVATAAIDYLAAGEQT